MNVLLQNSITSDAIARITSDAVPRVGELIEYLASDPSRLATCRVDQVIYRVEPFGLSATLLVTVIK